MSNQEDEFERGSGAVESVAPEGTLSTGIEILDDKLDGGIPAGQLVALSALPASQSELFLYKMAAVRETVYLTSERRATSIENSLRQQGVETSDVEIHRLSDDMPLDDARAALETLPERATVIVDPVDPLEDARANEYRTFLNDIKARTVETGGLALFHCLDSPQVPPQRHRTEYFADVIFDLNTELRGDSVENSLVVPKFRGGSALPEAVELELIADVTIDVSRKIA